MSKRVVLPAIAAGSLLLIAFLALKARKQKKQILKSLTPATKEEDNCKEFGLTGPHDLGGAGSNFGPIDRVDHPLTFFDKQVDALAGSLRKKKLYTVDEMRRGVEGMEPQEYKKASYYERWIYAITKVMLERGHITEIDLYNYLGPSNPEPKPIFQTDQYVRVRSEEFASRWRKPHLRTPGYIFQKVGKVTGLITIADNAEFIAFGGINDAKQPLYRVQFRQKDLWADYGGAAHDTLELDIFQHWIIPATEEEFVKQSSVSATKKYDHDHKHDDHKHDDHKHDDHDDHKHDQTREEIEQKAVDSEGPDSPYARLLRAMKEICIEKSYTSAEDIRQAVEAMEMAGLKGESNGARLIARAWVDPSFKKRLLENVNEAAKEIGLTLGEYPQIKALENTKENHNVVVCTLCSCYPRALLGHPPTWYKSRSYRARTVTEPRKVLSEFGLNLPTHVTVNAFDSASDLRYLVLPQQPSETIGWDEDKLAKIITRDCLIGLAVPKVKA